MTAMTLSRPGGLRRKKSRGNGGLGALFLKPKVAMKQAKNVLPQALVRAGGGVAALYVGGMLLSKAKDPEKFSKMLAFGTLAAGVVLDLMSGNPYVKALGQSFQVVGGIQLAGYVIMSKERAKLGLTSPTDTAAANKKGGAPAGERTDGTSGFGNVINWADYEQVGNVNSYETAANALMSGTDEDALSGYASQLYSNNMGNVQSVLNGSPLSVLN